MVVYAIEGCRADPIGVIQLLGLTRSYFSDNAMHSPRCVDVKADGLAKIVQPKQRRRGRICRICGLENAAGFEETVAHTISIYIRNRRYHYDC